MGTRNNLLAYDVERNADLFFRDVQDGANALCVGRMGSGPPLVVVGGNCSVLGFNVAGGEAFWTVTGDNVSALEIVDVDGDGVAELVVGSDDFELRAFRREELLSEASEADRVLFLRALQGDRFAYGLADGTVGVYQGMKTRLWRVRSRHALTALCAFDLDADASLEVLSGFGNGSFNARCQNSGEVRFKGQLGGGIVAMLVHDYRLIGRAELVVCADTGEVRGFGQAQRDPDAATKDLADQRVIHELQQRKSELTAELRLLEEGLRLSKGGEAPVAPPPAASVAFELFAQGCLSLQASSSSDALIVSLVAADPEGATLVGGDVQTASPAAPCRTAALRLQVRRVACCLSLQVHLLSRGAQQMHVLEASVSVPKFAELSELSAEKLSGARPPRSRVTLSLNETVASVAQWMRGAFIVTPSFARMVGKDSLRVGYVSASAGLLVVEAAQAAEAVALTLRCDDVALCGDLVQDLARHFKLESADCAADFPDEFARFEEVARTVAEGGAARIRLAADMADDSQRVKVPCPPSPPLLLYTRSQGLGAGGARGGLAADAGHGLHAARVHGAARSEPHAHRRVQRARRQPGGASVLAQGAQPDDPARGQPPRGPGQERGDRRVSRGREDQQHERAAEPH